MPSVLVTCPPMLGMIDEFAPLLIDAGYSVDAPNVVQTLSEDALIERIGQHAGWIIGDDPATRRVFEAGHGGALRAAVKWGVGVDNVDFDAARACGIEITNTPNMFGREVADVAMAYVTGLARELFFIDREVRTGGWPKPRGISLHGKTVALVGYGDIGSNTAARLLAAGLEVIVYDPAASPPTERPGLSARPWPDGLETCDFIVLTCALTASSRHMLNATTLARCKRGVRVVNVARGPLIDEAALVAGLRDGTVASAALDVMEHEPLAPDSPLREFPQCIFGSHNGSNTLEAVRATSLRAIDTLLGFLA